MFIIMWFIDCCMTMNNEPTILCCDNDDYQKWSLYEGCHGNDSICSDMDDCEEMLTDAWLIHCGPCIINIPEEFSNLELSKKCDVLLILNNNNKETHNNKQQHDDGFHTLQDKVNDLVLCNTSQFCSSGFDKECNTKGCPKVNKCWQRKLKKCQQGEQNLIYLTNWPFIHPPNATTNSTKMLIIKPPPPPPFDDEQRQQCTCLNAISYTKKITTSYSFSKPPM